MHPMDRGAVPFEGSWTHSYEEDQGDVMVFRPTESFPFPPTRQGRDTLQVTDSGSLAILQPGPDDRPRETGQWRPLGMNRYFSGGTPEAPGEVIEILEAGPDVLRLRRSGGA